MTLQWPREREEASRQACASAAFTRESDFRRLLAACPNGFPASFDETVAWLIRQGDDTTELDRRVAMVCAQVDFREIPDCPTLLMILVCAKALAQAPLLETWEKVSILKSNAWPLEAFLASAMKTCAEDSSEVRAAYLALAREVYLALDRFALQSRSDRTNKERMAAWANWNDRQDRLDEIWWGLRWWNEMNYQDEFPLLELSSALAPGEFIGLVTQSANPFLVKSALLAANAGDFSGRFSRWRQFAAAAPHAFEVDGTWNGSVLAPLLLVDARNQILLTGRNLHHFDASSDELEAVKREISTTAEAVVGTLATRPDAMPLFSRWSAWLMRQVITRTDQDISDVRSSAFVNQALIEAIGRGSVRRSHLRASPGDAPEWEPWCYRCVLASHASDGLIDPPNCEDFLAEWSMSPEEWAGKKGQGLRGRASLFLSAGKGIPGIAAHSLAYPIVRSKSPTEAWIGLWNATHALREIVEFGDADAGAGANDHQSRAEAAQLLLLVFRIGLAILDQRSAQSPNSGSPTARSQAKLHEALASALREMREIDGTRSRDDWSSLMRHLAVRRLILEKSAPSDTKTRGWDVFRPDDKPTFGDYLIAAKNDAVELLAILQSVLLNDADIPRLQNELDAASVNLAGVLAMIRRLNRCDQNRYPIDESQLKQVEALLNRVDVSSD